MSRIRHSKFLIVVLLFTIVACNKGTENDGPYLPAGVTPYSDEEVATVPYTGNNLIFKKAPDFTEELELTFIERLPTKEFYAWDQTYFQVGTDPYLKVELRLRYLQTENITQKSLAIYMPYWDDAGVIQSTIFEYPILLTDFNSTFFENQVTYHDTLELAGAEWLHVFEISPLISTPASEETDENYNKVFYSTSFGIIGMNQRNGDEWVLQP